MVGEYGGCGVCVCVCVCVCERASVYLCAQYDVWGEEGRRKKVEGRKRKMGEGPQLRNHYLPSLSERHEKPSLSEI